MTTSFVNSGAAGANTGASWTDAWVSLASANGVNAGDIVKVHKAHSQTTLAASITWANGTLANPVRIVCVDKDAADALATGAVIGWNATNLGPIGNIYVYGCTIQSSGANLRLTGGAGGMMTLDTCTVKSTSSGAVVIGDTTNARYLMRWINTSLDLSGASNAAINLSFANVVGLGNFEWFGGTYTCRATQTNLFIWAGTIPMNARIEGVNFSGTVTNLFSSATTTAGTFIFGGCTAPTYTNVYSTAPTNPDARLNMDGLVSGTLSAALLQPVNENDVFGSITATSARYRTGGANDGSQANAYSWAMVTLSTSGTFSTPLCSPWITRWVGTGSQAVTIYVAGGATLNNDELWIEVLSPSEAGTATPQAKFQTTRLAILGTPGALTTDGTSTWNGTGVGTMQKMSVTVNPTVPGELRVRVCLAKASTTVYVDPVIELAGDVAGNSRFMGGAQQFAATSASSGGVVVPTNVYGAEGVWVG